MDVAIGSGHLDEFKLLKLGRCKEMLIVLDSCAFEKKLIMLQPNSSFPGTQTALSRSI